MKSVRKSRTVDRCRDKRVKTNDVHVNQKLSNCARRTILGKRQASSQGACLLIVLLISCSQIHSVLAVDTSGNDDANTDALFASGSSGSGSEGPVGIPDSTDEYDVIVGDENDAVDINTSGFMDRLFDTLGWEWPQLVIMGMIGIVVLVIFWALCKKFCCTDDDAYYGRTAKVYPDDYATASSSRSTSGRNATRIVVTERSTYDPSFERQRIPIPGGGRELGSIAYKPNFVATTVSQASYDNMPTPDYNNSSRRKSSKQWAQLQ